MMSLVSPARSGHFGAKTMSFDLVHMNSIPKTRAFTRVPSTSFNRRRRCNIISNAASAPDRAVIILPGLGNNAADYNNLAAQLQSKESYNLHVEIAPVARIDWSRNAAGLLDTAYWAGTLKPRPTVDWYLNRIDSAIQAAKTAAPHVPITLLAHSAGGWLGRLYMLEYGSPATQGIDRFLSLGSPHLAPPPGVVDQTRGILTWISENCPGCYHEDVEYVTIAGRYIKGAKLSGPGGWQQRIVGAGYQQVCGDAAVWGDGVVPVTAAHLEGALQLTLDGVYHSPLGAEEGSVDEKNGENNEISATLTEMKQNETNQEISGGDGGGSVITSTNAGSKSGTYYDSDEYEVSIESVEQAAAAAQVSPGPRLWYGSSMILKQWAPLLKSTSTNTSDGGVEIMR